MESCQVRATGSKSSIEKSDPKLASEWREAAKRKVENHKVQKTARDRWSLIRLVSRISISIRQRNTTDGSWITDQEAHVVNIELKSIYISIYNSFSKLKSELNCQTTFVVFYILIMVEKVLVLCKK